MLDYHYCFLLIDTSLDLENLAEIREQICCFSIFILSNFLIFKCQAGGLDSLTLNSLYDEGAYRAAQQPVYGAPAPNPFELQDSFAGSNGFSPLPSIQMTSVTQPQVNPFGAAYQPSYQQPLQQQHPSVNPTNPFGDTGFGPFPANPHAHQKANNPFGSTGLL